MNQEKNEKPAALQVWEELSEGRKLAWQLGRSDFKRKYAGSYLGTIWAFVQPVVTVFVYWFVFEKGLGNGSRILSREGLEAPFVLYLVSGLVPWFFFQDALVGCTNSLIEYVYLVKKVVFRISILPFVKVLSALFVHVFFVVFCLLVFLFYGYTPGITAIQVVYYSAAMVLLVLGIGYLTSAIQVFFRDLLQIVGIVLQVGIWFTPIMWSMTSMQQRIPGWLAAVFKLNPMYYIVNGYRDALINRVWFWEHPLLTLYFWAVTIFFFLLGTSVFKKLRIHFADVL